MTAAPKAGKGSNATTTKKQAAHQVKSEESQSESEFQEEDKVPGIREKKFLNKVRRLASGRIGAHTHLATADNADPLKHHSGANAHLTNSDNKNPNPQRKKFKADPINEQTKPSAAKHSRVQQTKKKEAEEQTEEHIYKVDEDNNPVVVREPVENHKKNHFAEDAD